MINEKEIALINKTLEVLGESGKYAVEAYSNYFFIQAIGYISLGLFIMFMAAFKLKGVFEGTDIEGIEIIFKPAFFTIGCMLVICNVPDLFYPEAYAIRTLLKDLLSR
jgi:hypothetical protein